MKRNKKTELYKEYLRLKNELDELNSIQRGRSYYELDEPIHHGYDVKWVLRDDIARSPMGEELQVLLDNFSRSSWCINKDLVKKYKRGTDEKVKPRWVSYPKWRYDNLKDQYKKWFVIDYQTKDYSSYYGVHYNYKVSVPDYFLVEKRVKSYITHREILDPDLASQINQLENLLESRKFYKFGTMKYTGIKCMTTEYNRSDRSFNKRQLKKNISTIELIEYLDEDPLTKNTYKDHDWCDVTYWSFNGVEYRYKHRNNAKWMWW